MKIIENSKTLDANDILIGTDNFCENKNTQNKNLSIIDEVLITEGEDNYAIRAVQAMTELVNSGKFEPGVSKIFEELSNEKVRQVLKREKRKQRKSIMSKKRSIFLYMVMSMEVNFIKIGLATKSKGKTAERYHTWRDPIIAYFELKKEEYESCSCFRTPVSVEQAILERFRDMKLGIQCSNTETFLRFKNDDKTKLIHNKEFLTKMKKIIGKQLEKKDAKFYLLAGKALEKIRADTCVSINDYPYDDYSFFIANNLKYICSPGNFKKIFVNKILTTECVDENMNGDNDSISFDGEIKEENCDINFFESDEDEAYTPDKSKSNVIAEDISRRSKSKRIVYKSLKELLQEASDDERSMSVKKLKLDYIGDSVLDEQTSAIKFKPLLYYAAYEMNNDDNRLIEKDYKQLLMNNVHQTKRGTENEIFQLLFYNLCIYC
jgi:hypothetical protein